MTRDEAKKIMENAVRCVRNPNCERLECRNCYLVMPEHTVLKAYDVAIKALEQQTCEDAISRSEAIKALKDVTNLNGEPLFESLGLYPWNLLNELPSVQPKPTECEDAVSRQAVLGLFAQNADATRPYNKTWEEVKALPSVNPQPKWIPVSERLPEDGRPVLIYAWNVHHVVARYDSFRTENGYKKCWVTADAWNGNTEIKHKVVAWMPLPEPYKAESEG